MTVLASATDCPDALLAGLLTKAPLFVGVDPTVFASVNKTFRTRFFRDGEIICREGDAADALLVIWNGGVEITRERIHLAARGEGEVIGEQALIEGVQRGATVTAKGTVQVVAVPYRRLQQLTKRPGLRA